MPPSRRVKPYRILLVEDSEADAELLRRGLRRSPYAAFLIRQVPTLADALERLEHEEPDVIVLNLGLPDATGTDGILELHERAPDIPVVVLTGRAAEDETAAEVLRAGAQDFMSKADADWAQLGRTLFHAIERHGVQRELRATSEELKQANDKLERLVQLDPLTGMLNRRGLAGALPAILALAEREGKLAFALMADLDDFKQINDRLGYSVGDILMREVATRIRKNLRPTDQCGRLGGDELMVLYAVDREIEAWHVAERIRISLTDSFLMLRSGPVRITASFALVRLDEQHTLLDRVMVSADEALQTSKKLGKNRISRQAPDPSPEPQKSDRLRAITALTRPESFVRVTQPLVRLSDEAVVGLEYLSRFVIAPYESPQTFFPLAAEAKVLTTVDHLCFQGCVAEARRQPAELRHHFNLLPITLLSLAPDHLVELLRGLPRQRIYLEVSEQQILGDAGDLVAAVAHLRWAGAKLALDDVGFGRSSLESIVLLEPDVIKIDERCVSGVADHPGKQRTLERLLAICRTIDAEVIAEGVETAADRDLLWSLGVTHAQGKLWGMPS